MPGRRWFLWGGAFVALVALILIGRQGAVATLVFGTWVPLPLLVVGWRCGTGRAVLLAVAAGAAVLALNPSLAALHDHLGLWMLFLMGVILTAGHQRGWQAGSTIMLTTVALGVLSLALFGVQAFLEGLSPAAFWEQKSQEILATLSATLQQAGMDFADLRLAGLPSGEMSNLLPRILPALALINTALVAWLNVLVVGIIARRQGWDDAGEPLAQWACPEWLVFVLVAAGFALLAPPPWVRTIGLNLLLVVSLAYFCQGLAVVAALMQRYQAPQLLRALVYILAFINPLIIIVMLLGLADLWLDFRRLRPPREA
ncbi:MAG: DUF2232 domain-containing protein [Desulfobaccales bacterium]